MDPQKLSSQELVQLCLESQDEATWSEFVRRFEPLIAGVVLKSIRRWARTSPSLVEDLVHDTYVKLFANNCRALRDFDCQHENALFGFLKTIASNVVHDHFRGTYSQKRGSGRDEEDLDSLPAISAAAIDPQDRMDREILLSEVEDCLRSAVTDDNFTRDWTIFQLYYRQGVTARNISRLPGINLSVKGVESALLRLIRVLKDQLGDHSPEQKAGKRN
jgi:RNA polymerase sigma-70 factor (ECF subfamily)